MDSDFPDITKFNKINVSPVSDITLVDDTGGIDPLEYYRYAVETIYTNGFSEVTFSNSLLGSSLDVTDYQFLNSEISIFPNPAKEKITVKFGQNIQIRKSIEVFDVLGKNVFSIKPSEIINGYVTKNVNTLNAGMYFMKIDIEGVIVNKKFILN